MSTEYFANTSFDEIGNERIGYGERIKELRMREEKRIENNKPKCTILRN